VITMPTPAPINRRTALKGLGTALALPFLDIMSTPVASAAATQTAKTRLAFIYVPNGVHMPDWTPATEGVLSKLTPTLQPLTPFRERMSVLSGLTLDKARANGDGPGDHARAMSAFLTGRQPRKTHGADIRAGMSADQWVATNLRDYTPLPSLELGIERGQQAGNCDSGYSCAYSSNMSWRSESTPNAKEVDPKQVFERLFGNGERGEQNAARAKRELYQSSVLDFVREDAQSLSRQLGASDTRKMDEYFTAVRELEVRIQRAKEEAGNRQKFQPTMAQPSGVPGEMQDHVRLMCDLMVLSYQGDMTRVVTLPFANDGSNRAYPMIGVSDGHHNLSHHGRDEKKQAKIAQINKFHIEQLAYLLTKLQSVKEGDHTLLDQMMIVYGSGIGDGDRHNHDDLPILLIGNGGGKLKTGKHMQYAKNTPLMNLYLTLFDAMGTPTNSFGDSTGRLALS